MCQLRGVERSQVERRPCVTGWAEHGLCHAQLCFEACVARERFPLLMRDNISMVMEGLFEYLRKKELRDQLVPKVKWEKMLGSWLKS